MMSYVIAIFIVAVCLSLLGHFINVPHDPREPPLIPPSIPFLGHIVGMIRDGSGYYGKVMSVIKGSRHHCNLLTNSILERNITYQYTPLVCHEIRYTSFPLQT